jgi:Arc/MetJ-type ribon-helix-helix transcriptional regulator
MKTIKVELPDKLYDQVKLLISEGWFKDEKELICEALRNI